MCIVGGHVLLVLGLLANPLVFGLWCNVFLVGGCGGIRGDWRDYLALLWGMQMRY